MNTEYINKVLSWNNSILVKGSEEIDIHVTPSYTETFPHEGHYIAFEEDGTTLYEFIALDGADNILDFIIKDYLKKGFIIKESL